MPIDYDALMAFRIPEVERTYTERDTMLYGLAVGMGSDPTDPRELAFVLEPDPKVVPSMATVIAWNHDWLYETGIDMVNQVHGEQRITLHRPLPPAATVIGHARITDVFDKGPGKGALLITETTVRDKATGELLCTNQSVSFARGDGGFGGPPGSGPPPHPMPGREPDAMCDLRTQPNQALLYRLCGDRNPLHADPTYAATAGYPRPILHGLCTFGHACAAVLKTRGGYAAERIRGLAVRFTSPVFPGETIRTEMWQDGDVVGFRSRVVERDTVVLNHGAVILR